MKKKKLSQLDDHIVWSNFWLIPVRVGQRWSNLAKNGKFGIWTSRLLKWFYPRLDWDKKDFFHVIPYYMNTVSLYRIMAILNFVLIWIFGEI